MYFFLTFSDFWFGDIKWRGPKVIKLNETEKIVDIRSTRPRYYNGNTFQGHRVKIRNVDDISSALHTIRLDGRVAKVKHNIYAYRLQTDDGYFESCHGDGEWGAGEKLLALLHENGVENQLLCITRLHNLDGRSYLGSAKFDHIIKTAKETLNL